MSCTQQSQHLSPGHRSRIHTAQHSAPMLWHRCSGLAVSGLGDARPGCPPMAAPRWAGQVEAAIPGAGRGRQTSGMMALEPCSFVQFLVPASALALSHCHRRHRLRSLYIPTAPTRSDANSRSGGDQMGLCVSAGSGEQVPTCSGPLTGQRICCHLRPCVCASSHRETPAHGWDTVPDGWGGTQVWPCGPQQTGAHPGLSPHTQGC